jgi:hypothetical protein
MANETSAPKKRRSSGPRQQRPVFALVRYTDENGNQTALNKDGLSIQIERDSGKIVEMLTSGDGTGGATVVRVELPQPTPRKAAEPAA